MFRDCRRVRIYAETRFFDRIVVAIPFLLLLVFIGAYETLAIEYRIVSSNALPQKVITEVISKVHPLEVIPNSVKYIISYKDKVFLLKTENMEKSIVLSNLYKEESDILRKLLLEIGKSQEEEKYLFISADDMRKIAFWSRYSSNPHSLTEKNTINGLFRLEEYKSTNWVFECQDRCVKEPSESTFYLFIPKTSDDNDGYIMFYCSNNGYPLLQTYLSREQFGLFKLASERIKSSDEHILFPEIKIYGNTGYPLKAGHSMVSMT